MAILWVSEIDTAVGRSVAKQAAELIASTDRLLLNAKEQSERRGQVLAAVRMTPSAFLRDPLHNLASLLRLVLIDDEVQNYQQIMVEHNQELTSSLRLVITAFTKALEDSRSLDSESSSLIAEIDSDTSEFRSSVEQLETAIRGIEDELKRQKEVLAQKTVLLESLRGEARAYEGQIREIELRLKQIDDQSSLSSQPWYWNMKQSAWRDLKLYQDKKSGIENVMRIQEASIKETQDLISKIGQAISETKSMKVKASTRVAEIQRQAESSKTAQDALGDISNRLISMHGALANVYASVKVGLQDSYRSSFVRSVLQVLLECPVDAGVLGQIRGMVCAFDGLPGSNRIKAESEMQLESIHLKVDAQLQQLGNKM